MHQVKQQQAFTLIELLVVVSIIALLIGILLPVLGSARHSARAMQCMSNMRQLGIAHYAYTTEHNGELIKAALAHGGGGYNGDTFVMQLRDYWDSSSQSIDGEQILARSPLDDSPHWGPAPAGQPVPGGDASQRRRTSYGLNDYLTTLTPLASQRHTRLHQISDTSNTVHMLAMAYTGSFAGSDHVHATGWFRASGPPAHARASDQAQTNSVSGETGAANAVSNYAFLDGHVEQTAFDSLGTGPESNKFNPDATP